MRLVILILTVFLSNNLSAEEGAIWLVDQSGPSLKRIMTDGSIATEFALPGDAQALATAADGSVWVGVIAPQELLHVSREGELIASVSTTVPVNGLAIDAAGHLWATESSNDFLTEYSAEGEWIQSITVGALPLGVAVHPDGSVWTTLAFDNAVARFVPSSSTLEQFPTGFLPTDIQIHPNGSVWVLEKEGISVLASDGSPEFSQLIATLPRSLVIARDGTIWLTCEGDLSVSRYESGGALIGSFGGGLLPGGIAASGDGSIAVYCRLAGEVWRFDSGGTLLNQIAVSYPQGVGDMTGLALATVVAPDQDHDGDEAPNRVEVVRSFDPTNFAESPPTFIRGDIDADGQLSLGDVFRGLDLVFGDLGCAEAGDVDDDGELSLVDVVLILEYLYSDGVPPVAPFPNAGYDQTYETVPCP